MRVLLDQNVPRPITAYLAHHAVESAYKRGWAALANGELLRAVETEGFEVFVTADQNLRYQQNLTGRRVAIVVIGTNFWPSIARNPQVIVAAVDAARPGTVVVVEYPKPPRPSKEPFGPS